MVEDFRNDRLNLDFATLKQAIINVQIKDNFYVKWVNSMDDSLNYLKQMHLFLKEKYISIGLVAREPARVSCSSAKTGKCPNASLQACTKCHEQPLLVDAAGLLTCYPFEIYNCVTSPRQAIVVRDMFAMHLLQFPGLTAEKAMIIVNHFPTLLSCMDGLAQGTDPDEMITRLLQQHGQKRESVKIGKLLHHYYVDKVLMPNTRS